MAPQQGEAIDTLFVDLAVRTEKLQQEMNAALTDLKKKIEVGLKEPMDDVERRYASFGDVAKNTFMSVGAVLVQTKNPIAALTSGLSTFRAGLMSAAQGGAAWATSLGGLIAPLGALIAVLGVVVPLVQKFVAFIQQTGEAGVQMAARIQTLHAGMAVVAKNASVFLTDAKEKVQELQATGITTREAIESVMQFMTQGLPIENMEKLARAGQDIAVAFGANSTETFNRFVYAIVTGNTEVLRMVGINKTASQMQEEFAKTIGRTAEQLTVLERKQAIIEGIMKAAQQYTGLYEKSMESLGKRIGSLPRYIEEGTLALGQTLIPLLEMGVTATENFWKAFQKLFVVMTEVKDEAGKVKLVPELDYQGNQKLTAFGQSIEDIADIVKEKLEPAIKDATKLLGELDNALERVSAILTPVGRSLSQIGQLIDWGPEIRKVRDALLEFGIALERPGPSGEPPQQFIIGLGAAWEGFKNIVIASVSGLVGGLFFLADALENINRLLTGQTVRSWDEMADRAEAASMRALLAMLNVKQAQQAASGPVDTTREEAIFESRDTSGVGLGISEEESVKAQKMMSDLMAIFDEAQAQREQAFQNYTDALWKLNDDFMKALKKNGEEFLKAQAELKKAFDERKAELEKDYQEALTEVDQGAEEARAKENENYQKAQEKAKADFLFRMKRMEEDYALTLADAVQNRDARQVLLIMRNYGVQKRRAEEDFDRQEKEREENHEDRLDEIDKQEDEIRERLRRNYEKQLKQLGESLDKQLDRLNDAYVKQQKALSEAYTRQQTSLEEAYQKQLAAINTAQQKRLETMAIGWANAKLTTEAGLKGILAAINKLYGVGGDVDGIVNAFNDRLKRNKAFEDFLNTIKSLALYYESIFGGSGSGGGGGGPPTCPSGYYWNGTKCTPGIQPTSVSTAGGPQAFGLATTAGLVAPAMFRNEMSSLPLGAAESKLEINVKVTADKNFSREFEDALLEKVADAIVEAMPEISVRRA